tara:strand:+ start:352 stop:747 length:396 start_codon:yes stop_codon:yes gene_type:complete
MINNPLFTFRLTIFVILVALAILFIKQAYDKIILSAGSNNEEKNIYVRTKADGLERLQFNQNGFISRRLTATTLYESEDKTTTIFIKPRIIVLEDNQKWIMNSDLGEISSSNQNLIELRGQVVAKKISLEE